MNYNRNYNRTDLACEAIPESTVRDGVSQHKTNKNGFEILTTEILTEEGSDAIGKPLGKYHTIFTNGMRSYDDSKKDDLITLVSNTLQDSVGGYADKIGFSADNFSFLVAGLGNRHLTADAIGPLTVDKVTVTRELKYSSPDLFKRISCLCVSALSPGVSAETGIEAADVIKGAVEAISPDVVILIDALAARSCSRLASTIQISDTGIYPGSGIGNKRTPIIEDTIGVPVITIGIPTIVDSSSLVYDALEKGGIDLDSLSHELIDVLSNGRSFFVSPKDCDIITEDYSTIIAHSIDRLAGLY